MKKEIRDKFPDWVNDNEIGKYTLCLSDDIDSLLSCKILEQVKGYEINYFYSFDKFYVADMENRKQAIGVDIALLKGKTWDNHITMLSSSDSVNEQSANLNAILKVSRDNYTDKFAGSTLLQIWSYYNIPLPQTEEGKMILLAIDSSYKGHYVKRFKDTQNDYLKMLGFEELIEVQERHSPWDFQQINNKYNLNEKINVLDGKLVTEINLNLISELLDIALDLSLPNEGLFYLHKKFKVKKTKISRNKTFKKRNSKSIFSLALTGTDFICYSSKS